MTTTPPVRELPKVTAGSSVASAAAVARVASKARQGVVESAAPVRRPEPSVPVKRTPVAPAGREVTEMTLADLAAMLHKRKNGVREVYAGDPTDRDDLFESGEAPIVMARSSQAPLVARMLGRR